MQIGVTAIREDRINDGWVVYGHQDVRGVLHGACVARTRRYLNPPPDVIQQSGRLVVAVDGWASGCDVAHPWPLNAKAP